MILVTGGTGTSGADIVRELSSRGVKFRALARNPAKAGDVRLPGVEIVQGDMVKSGAIYQPAGDGKSAYVDTRDIASVAVVTLTQSGHEGKSYPITGPADLSFHDIAATFSKVLGRQIKYVDVPAEAARESLAKMGLPAWNVDGILELMDLLRSGKTAGLFRTVKQIAGK